MTSILTVMRMMAIKNYISSLTKSVRGDGQVSGDGFGNLIQVIEREVTHDVEELGRIQSMQSTAVSLNNSKFNAMRRVERVTYEGIFFGLYFGAKLFAKASVGLLDIIMVKSCTKIPRDHVKLH